MFATRSQLAKWLDLSLSEIDEIYLNNSIYKITHPCSGSYYDEDGIATHAKVVNMKDTHTQTQIARKLGKQIAVINRMCKAGYEPYKTNARYFSEFQRNKEWFLEI